MKSVSSGLNKALLRKEYSDAISTHVSNMNCIRFHALNLLQLYGHEVATLEKFESTKEVFDQSLIDQTIALIYQGYSKNAPSILHHCYETYCSGWNEIKELRKTWDTDILMNAYARLQLRVQMLPSFKNILEISNPKVQVQMLKKVYNLKKSEASYIAGFLGTSQENRIELCKDRIRKARFIKLKSKEAEFEAIARKDPKDITLVDIQLEIDSLDKELHTPVSDDVDIKLPETENKKLQKIFHAELNMIPETQSQFDQLKYRKYLLKQISQNPSYDGEDAGYTLVPVTDYTSKMVFFVKNTVRKMIQLVDSEVPETETMADLLPLVFTKKSLRNSISGKWHLSETFLTDGVRFNLLFMSDAAENGKRAKLEKRRRTNEIKREPDPIKRQEMKDEDEGRKRKREEDKRQENTKKRKQKRLEKQEKIIQKLPEGAILVGIDPGIVNIVGVSREDNEKSRNSSFVFPVKRFRHESGETNRRNRFNKWAKKEKKTNPQFNLATERINAVSLKTIDRERLLNCVLTRRDCFPVLYEFYGHQMNTRRRWNNYVGTQRVIHKLYEKVVQTKNDVFVIGDSNFGGNVRGQPAGLSSKFVSYLNKKLQGTNRVVYQDEYRTSMLDSDHYRMVIHPPKNIGERKDGVRFVRRNNGISQVSLSKDEFPNRGFSKTWNRDINAARNIRQNYRMKYETGSVPIEFTREITKLQEPRSYSYKYTIGLNGATIIKQH
jgi:hypothetical protein